MFYIHLPQFLPLRLRQIRAGFPLVLAEHPVAGAGTRGFPVRLGKFGGQVFLRGRGLQRWVGLGVVGLVWWVYVNY